MKTWPCFYTDRCSTPVSELGAYVKLATNRYAHLNCHNMVLAVSVIFEYEAEKAQKEAHAVYEKQAELDTAKMREEKDLLRIYDNGAPTQKWVAADRQRLVAAKWICVHCGKRINVPGEPGAGGEGKHCRACYVASQYGEQQAAQGAAKSAASIEAAKQVLAGEPKPKEEPKKQEETKKSDRFELIDLE